MSALGKAALFALRAVAKPALEKLGEHVGEGVGEIVRRKLDPTYRPVANKTAKPDVGAS